MVSKAFVNDDLAFLRNHQSSQRLEHFCAFNSRIEGGCLSIACCSCRNIGIWSLRRGHDGCGKYHCNWDVNWIFSVPAPPIRSHTLGRRPSSADPGLGFAFWPISMPDDALPAVGQAFLDRFTDKGIGFDPQRSRRHQAHALTRKLGQRVIHLIC